MGRPPNSGRTKCEFCISIDVRRWHREDRLQKGQRFSWSWERSGEPAGSIGVRVERDSVVLTYRVWNALTSEWKSIEQRVPITWTTCHFGGQRLWFVCPAHSNGHDCGRRVAVLYCAGELFACRRCYRLAYASQQQTPLLRAY